MSRIIFGTVNPTTGLVTITNPGIGTLITTEVADGSTYTVDIFRLGRVALTKDGDTVTAWADGEYTLEAVSSTCGVSDCVRKAYEVLCDHDTNELYRIATPSGHPIGVGTSNTCTGHNCAACAFTYDASGQNIVGCKCTQGGGTCDHSISQTA